MKLIETFCAGALLLAAWQANAADLTIHVDDVKAAGGRIEVAAYSSAGTFLQTAAGAASTAATRDANTVVLKDLLAGDYAFRVPRRQFERQAGQEPARHPDRRLCLQQ